MVERPEATKGAASPDVAFFYLVVVTFIAAGLLNDWPVLWELSYRHRGHSLERDRAGMQPVHSLGQTISIASGDMASFYGLAPYEG